MNDEPIYKDAPLLASAVMIETVLTLIREGKVSREDACKAFGKCIADLQRVHGGSPAKMMSLVRVREICQGILQETGKAKRRRR